MTTAFTRQPFSWAKFARSFAGLLLAPVIGGSAALFLFTLPDMFGGHARLDDIVGMAMFGGAYGGMLGVLPALLIGWPLHLILLRLRWTSIFVYLALGAVLGLGALFISGPLLEMIS